MNRFAKAFRRALKAFPFPGWGWGGYGVGGLRGFGMLSGQGLPDERDYRSLVGDGANSSLLGACIGWIARTFSEAPPALWSIDNDGVFEKVGRHPMLNVLRFPTSSPDNPGGYYSGVLLWMATLASFIVDGNAYWLKVRSKVGRVVQLWYVPHWMILPRWPLDGSAYLSHYDYFVNGQILKVSPSEIVHFRYGLDPDNPRLGKSPAASVLREIYSDMEAARFSASLLHNLGVPGVILSPSPGTEGKRPSEDELHKIKETYKAAFGGDNRGDVMVLGTPTQVSQFAWSPQQLDLSAIRHLAEERVTAALGIPTAIVGFGSGLQTTKVGKTLAEYKDQAYEGGILPTQRMLGSEIHTQLLPEFQPDIENYEFGFDLSRVMVFQDARIKEANYWSTVTNAKLAKRSEARRALNLPVATDGSDDIYIESTASATGSPNGDTQSQIDATVDDSTDTPPTNQSPQPVEVKPGAIVVHNHFEAPPAPQMILEPGAIEVNVAPPVLNVAEGAFQSKTILDKGSLAVTVEQQAESVELELVRDERGQLTGTRKRKSRGDK